MTLCSNRPEGFGPQSHLYSHILTSCFLDTILVPLCTWLYLLALLILFCLPTKPDSSANTPFFSRTWRKTEKPDSRPIVEEEPLVAKRSGLRMPQVLRTTLLILYYLLLLAQILMCTLEIVRLALAHLGIGLLPVTYVTLLGACVMRLTRGLGGKMRRWRWANIAIFVALAVTNGVKVAEEVKEGVKTRKGTKYPESDQIIDVSVMIGVYTVLMILEPVLG